MKYPLNEVKLPKGWPEPPEGWRCVGLGSAELYHMGIRLRCCSGPEDTTAWRTAIYYGATPSFVYAAPCALVRPLCRYIVPKADWQYVDWAKSNQELGKILGVGFTAVSKQRIKYAPQTSRSRLAMVPMDTTGVDWSTSIRKIAKQLGVPVTVAERIRSRRLQPEKKPKRAGWKKH